MATKKQTRKTVSIQLSKDEVRLADDLADRFKCSRAAVLRMGLEKMKEEQP